MSQKKYTTFCLVNKQTTTHTMGVLHAEATQRLINPLPVHLKH